jgi:sigma-E factor negative regulatory protein RseB
VQTKLEAEGWQLKASVPGFKLVNCTKRPLAGPFAPPTSGGAEAQMLQAVYSDGLTYVSLFIEPYDSERHTRPLATAIGATQTMMRRLGDWWITAMGDVPAATLRQFFQGLERKGK